MGSLTYRSSAPAGPSRTMAEAIASAVEVDDNLPVGFHEWSMRANAVPLGKVGVPASWSGGYVTWQCEKCGSLFKEGSDDPSTFPGCDEALVENLMEG